MHKQTRYLILILILLITLIMAACGGAGLDEASDTQSDSPADDAGDDAGDVAEGEPVEAEEPADEAVEEEMDEADADTDMADEEAVEQPPAEDTGADDGGDAASDSDDAAVGAGGAGGDDVEVAYGEDNRLEPFLHPDLILQEMAGSVAILVNAGSVSTSEDKAIRIEGPTFGQAVADAYGMPLCLDQLYADQVLGGSCTGFLIADDILVTAGHCIPDQTQCEETRFIFDFRVGEDGRLSDLSSDQMYQCADLLAQVYTPDAEDYAIVQLDRSTGRVGLPISEDARYGDPLAVIGHPSGLPLKIASDAILLKDDPNLPYFVTNLDTFSGSSGSPVINLRTHEVVGLLARGEDDFRESAGGTCIEVNRCPEELAGECTGEEVVRMGAISYSEETEPTLVPTAEPQSQPTTIPIEPTNAPEPKDSDTGGDGLCGSGALIMLLMVLPMAGMRRRFRIE